MKSKLNIVSRAIEAFEGSDKTNLEKFYSEIIKNAESKITTKKRFIANKGVENVEEIEQLEKNLEDAVEEVKNAQISINPELLKTNAGRTEQISKFWGNVNNARRIVAKIESEIEEVTETYTKLAELTALEIEQLESDIADLKK
jgi:putative cell wall-binding protein